MEDLRDMDIEESVDKMGFYFNLAILMTEVAETYVMTVEGELEKMKKGKRYGELKALNKVLDRIKNLRAIAHSINIPTYNGQQQKVSDNFADCSDFLAEANVDLFKRIFSAPKVELAILNAIRKFPTSINVEVVSEN